MNEKVQQMADKRKRRGGATRSARYPAERGQGPRRSGCVVAHRTHEMNVAQAPSNCIGDIGPSCWLSTRARLGAVALTMTLGMPMLAGCGDPVHDALIESLGSEDPAVPVGPLHRPGQPCVACHREGGEASAFSFAGTVVTEVTSDKPVGEVSVAIIDSARRTFTATTNCAGNFFIRTSEFVPRYPVWTTIRLGEIEREMSSPWYREGSCAGCHVNPRSETSSGPVYLIEDPLTELLPPSRCN